MLGSWDPGANPRLLTSSTSVAPGPFSPGQPDSRSGRKLGPYRASLWPTPERWRVSPGSSAPYRVSSPRPGKVIEFGRGGLGPGRPGDGETREPPTGATTRRSCIIARQAGKLWTFAWSSSLPKGVGDSARSAPLRHSAYQKRKIFGRRGTMEACRACNCISAC